VPQGAPAAHNPGMEAPASGAVLAPRLVTGAGETFAPGGLAWEDGLLAYVGAADGLAAEARSVSGAVIPGFVDCHTHLPFAGWRADEYEMKVTGVPYEQIARSGGGIASSARAFGASSDEAILAQARTIAGEMLTTGTTTFEGKTGYGLSVDAERRAVRLGRALGDQVEQSTRVTGLFAHAVPTGFTAARCSLDFSTTLAMPTFPECASASRIRISASAT